MGGWVVGLIRTNANLSLSLAELCKIWGKFVYLEKKLEIYKKIWIFIRKFGNLEKNWILEKIWKFGESLEIWKRFVINWKFGEKILNSEKH